MSDLRELYQEVILDHNRRPRNYHAIERPSRTAKGHNPLCGDRLTLYLMLENDRITDVGFEGSGCAISKASASLMTTAVKGKTRDEADQLFGKFHDLVLGTLPESEQASLGSLRALGGVSRFPLRVKCASLAWHALRAALEQGDDEISTEREGPEPPPLEGA
jgi:nitrogen fixation NifU-like protein